MAKQDKVTKEKFDKYLLNLNTNPSVLEEMGYVLREVNGIQTFIKVISFEKEKTTLTVLLGIPKEEAEYGIVDSIYMQNLVAESPIMEGTPEFVADRLFEELDALAEKEALLIKEKKKKKKKD